MNVVFKPARQWIGVHVFGSGRLEEVVKEDILRMPGKSDNGVMSKRTIQAKDDAFFELMVIWSGKKKRRRKARTKGLCSHRGRSPLGTCPVTQAWPALLGAQRPST